MACKNDGYSGVDFFCVCVDYLDVSPSDKIPRQMPEDKSLDIAGVGKALEAIPEPVWMEVVSTATNTFKDLVRPITAITAGVGRWMEQKFTNMVEVEKVLLADAVDRAQKKMRASEREVAPTQNLATLAAIVDGVSTSTDELLREMWVNLLARDLSSDAVHPEFIAILGRLSPSDAQLLADIAEKSEDAKQRASMKRMMDRVLSRSRSAASPLTLDIIRKLNQRPFDLGETMLLRFGLIEVDAGFRYLTTLGAKFLAAVNEPEPKSPPTEG